MLKKEVKDVDGKIKRVFPGANTSKGFFSYYDYIIGEDANRVFILKGGPGTGKSTFMKNIAKDMLDRGYDLEYHHCSSDNNSIDGIVIKPLKVAIIDGTSPHMIDPKYPGAIDEIINLGRYWEEKSIVENKNDIVKYIKENKEYYKRAYKYLDSAKNILQDIEYKVNNSMDFVKVNNLTDKLLHAVFGDVNEKGSLGRKRHLFGSGYTPNGLVEHTETIINDSEEIYYIDGYIGSGKTTLFNILANEAIKKGLNVEVYHSPLIPEKIETVIIEELSVAFTKSSKAQDFDNKKISLNEYLNKKVLNQYKIEIDEDKEMYKKLIDIALKDLNKAKKVHDKIESYYIPNMNYTALDSVREEVISKIVQYEKKDR